MSRLQEDRKIYQRALYDLQIKVNDLRYEPEDNITKMRLGFAANDFCRILNDALCIKCGYIVDFGTHSQITIHPNTETDRSLLMRLTNEENQ